MPRAKKKTTTSKKKVSRKPRKQNIVGNFRGKEDTFWIKVRNGWKKIFSPPKY